MNQLDENKTTIQTFLDIKDKLLKDASTLEAIQRLAIWCLHSLKNGGKIIFDGNGGSFANSQHLAATFISRLQFDRERGLVKTEFFKG